MSITTIVIHVPLKFSGCFYCPSTQVNVCLLLTKMKQRFEYYCQWEEKERFQMDVTWYLKRSPIPGTTRGTMTNRGRRNVGNLNPRILSTVTQNGTS